MAESQNIEYKESWRDEYLKWLCGFANAQGGTIYIGIYNAGNAVGVKEVKKLIGTTLKIRFKALERALIGPTVPKHQRTGDNGALESAMVLKSIEILQESGRIERVVGKRYGHWEVL